MKTLDAVKIIDIARMISLAAMLAYVAILFIRFILGYIEVCVWFNTIYTRMVFFCSYARKRVVNRVDHERKDAVFTINPNGRAGLFGKW